MGIKILVVDDEEKFRELFAEILRGEGHDVHCARNLTEAREQLRSRTFHLMILDIVLEPDEDGLELLKDVSKLNHDTDAFCAPIIFTNYATKDRALQAIRQGVVEFREKQVTPEDFIISKIGKESRGFVEQELLDAVRKALGRVLLERRRRHKNQKYTLYLHTIPGQKTQIELTGPTSFVGESSNTFELDISDFSGQTDDLQFYFDAKDEAERLKWRTRAKSIGNNLYKQIIAKDAELNGCLRLARERSNHHGLSIVFRGTQDILRLPMELLPGETGQLVTEHPVIRQISNIMNVRNSGVDNIFEGRTTPLKVLLIGSNTYPPIPGVDDEISQLETEMRKLCLSRGIDSEIQVIPTQNASYENVYSFLERCKYHIVHYSGHGYHNENGTDESGLFFWEKQNKSGKVKSMPIRVLRNLLNKSDVRFFFLSCCVGARTADDHFVKLNGDDFQGILEGLVRVGIPSVLGYRWNIWDTDAKQFALAFYESLFSDLSLEVAIFNARRLLQETNYYSETWASPVLVMQTP